MYRMVYLPTHHRADVTGMVAEHVLIAERELERPLREGELVHHKDFDKLHNTDGNLLFPITRLQHQKLPEYQARFIIEKGLYDEFLKWWIQAQENDANNRKVYELTQQLVQAQNAHKRLKGKESRQCV